MGLDEKQKLERLCVEIRKEIARHGFESGRGHISSALSLVEVLVALYFGGGMDVGKIRDGAEDRDRVILSKGHGGLALYITLAKAGIIEESLLHHFASGRGSLSTHPVFGSAKGIEMSSGSLGQGIGFACGAALSGVMRCQEYHTYVIVGDGELQEGSNWESMLFASQKGLDKLVLIVDRNQLQISGEVDRIVSVAPLAQKLSAFGFCTTEVDGHNIEAVANVLFKNAVTGPTAVIANTIKGKGVPCMENKNGWHGKGLTEEEYREAMWALGGM